MSEKPHYHGHRERLRQRFAKSGAEALEDHELLELLLFGARPRGDTKPLAKKLLARFGSVGAVLGADRTALKEVDGAGEAVVHTLKLAEALAVKTLEDQVMERPVIASWQALLDYCRLRLAHRGTEHFRVLYLNNRNALIADEEQQRGTIDRVQLYPREVIKRALELGAAAVILVHNHPSGDPQPSRADVDMTREVAAAGAKLGVAVHDHLVIGRAGHVSFRSKGLLPGG